MSFDTARRLYLVRRTVLEMLQDRGYFIDKPELDLSREDFDDRYTSKDALAINWDEMTILVQHKEDPVDQIFVFFPADPKVGVKQVKAFAERMRSDKAAKAILVTEAKLTVFARQCLSEMAPKYHVELFLQSELLVNITRHSAVPQHELLSREERAELLRRYKAGGSAPWGRAACCFSHRCALHSLLGPE
ncbi:hypothetical protein ABPG75_000500 [Micractinium tetrahymenae]